MIINSINNFFIFFGFKLIVSVLRIFFCVFSEKNVCMYSDATRRWVRMFFFLFILSKIKNGMKLQWRTWFISQTTETTNLLLSEKGYCYVNCTLRLVKFEQKSVAISFLQCTQTKWSVRVRVVLNYMHIDCISIRILRGKVQCFDSNCKTKLTATTGKWSKKKWPAYLVVKRILVIFFWSSKFVENFGYRAECLLEP